MQNVEDMDAILGAMQQAGLVLMVRDAQGTHEE